MVKLYAALLALVFVATYPARAVNTGIDWLITRQTFPDDADLQAGLSFYGFLMTLRNEFIGTLNDLYLIFNGTIKRAAE